jgi:hypothetical protein
MLVAAEKEGIQVVMSEFGEPYLAGIVREEIERVGRRPNDAQALVDQIGDAAAEAIDRLNEVRGANRQFLCRALSSLQEEALPAVHAQQVAMLPDIWSLISAMEKVGDLVGQLRGSK